MCVLNTKQGVYACLRSGRALLQFLSRPFSNRSSGGGGASGGDSRTVTDAQRIESLIECWKIKGDLLCAGCHVGSKRPIVGLYGMFVACTEYKGRMKCTHKMSKSDLSAEELDAWCNPC